MERLFFCYDHQTKRLDRNVPAIAGVLGSGNLEVLVEPAALNGATTIEVQTTAVGFGEIWKAVLDDIAARWSIGNVAISINDSGATPAVVCLRVDQALQLYTGTVP